MPKKLTPHEQHVHDLVLKLKAIYKLVEVKPRMKGDPQPQEEMAADIGVERETLNRWLNWRMPPRGLSINAIERYIKRWEEEHEVAAQ